MLDRVILALSDNLLYEGFWEYSSKFWKNKFGVKPTLFFYGEPRHIKFDETCGEVFYLPFVEEVSLNPNRDWACTWGLFYGASMFENEICMTCGIDQAPLSYTFFDSVKNYNYDTDYVVGLSEAYNNDKWFVSSHHIAKGKIFKEALQIDDKWENEVKKVFAYRNNYGQMYGGNDYWGLDELYSSDKLSSYAGLKKHRGLYNYLYHNRLDRGYNLNLDLEKLKHGGYSEIHCPRPYKHHQVFLETVYEHTPCFFNTKQQ